MVATLEPERGAMRRELCLDSGPTREMVISLAGCLSRMRALGEKPRIRLEEEVSLAESYLEIGRIWFGGRMRLEAAIDPDAGDCLVPPLVLLPLLNPVAKPADAGVVRLEARRVGHRVRIVVESPLDSEAAAQSREAEAGPRTVRERLAAAYGADAIFAAKRLSHRRLAVISIPARESVQGRGEGLSVGWTGSSE